MYFMLGNVAFEPVNLTEFSENHAAEFAEHAVLKGKPRLQAMGERLQELTFAIRLHHQIGGVESRYQALLAAKARQDALALIWGRGKYKGNFVITDLSSTTLFTDEQGNALCRELTVSLKEFIGDMNGGLLGAALNLGGGSLLGSIIPPTMKEAFNTVKTAVSRGVELYQTGKRAVDEVKNTVALVRQLARDPASALAYLPQALGNLDNALGNFDELTGMSELLGGVRAVLPEIADFTRQSADIYGSLQEMKSHFSRADNRTGWEDWFVPADRALTAIEDNLNSGAETVAKITAWAVLRSDEEIEAETEMSKWEAENEPKTDRT